jgi:hypothetical protein
MKNYRVPDAGQTNSIKTLIRIVSEFFYKRANIDLYSDKVTTFGITTTKERII